MSEDEGKKEYFKRQQEIVNDIIKGIQKELREVFYYPEAEWCKIRQELVNTLSTIKKFKAEKKKEKVENCKE